VVEEFSTHKGIVPKACLFFFGTFTFAITLHTSLLTSYLSNMYTCFMSGLLAMGLLSMLDPPATTAR
jgi:hypothetical protein